MSDKRQPFLMRIERQLGHLILLFIVIVVVDSLHLVADARIRHYRAGFCSAQVAPTVVAVAAIIAFLIATWRADRDARVTLSLAVISVAALRVLWWLVDEALRVRLVRELAIVACIGAAVETFHIWMPRWFGSADRPTGAVVAAGLMAVVALASFIRDRSVDVMLMLILLALAALVPVVLVGRVVALVIARALWSLHS